MVKKFQPIEDDVDATVEAGDAMDMEPVEVPTLAQVKKAERLAEDMQKFFDLDDHWKNCEEAVQIVREVKRSMFTLEEIKSAELYTAHLQWLHYGEALNIMRDAHQAMASKLRAIWEEHKKATAETPLIDAAEQALSEALVDTDTGEVVGEGEEKTFFGYSEAEQLMHFNPLIPDPDFDGQRYSGSDGDGNSVIIYRDGNMWGAVREDFVNIQQSIVGFGETPYGAINDLIHNELNPDDSGMDGDGNEGDLEPDLAEVEE